MVKRVKIAAGADRTFSIRMGDEVEPRREFIEKNAKYVRNLSRGEAIPSGKGLSEGVLRTFGGCVTISNNLQSKEK